MALVRRSRTRGRVLAATVVVPLLIVGGCGEGGGNGGDADSGFGFTEDEVYVGFAVSINEDEAAGQAGLDLGGGDQRQQIEAVVADLNQRGGILGRTVVPVFHEVDTTIEDEAVLSQAACTAWTQDNQVATVSLTGLDDEITMGCLYDAGIPEFVELAKPFDDEWVAPFSPNVVGLSGLSFDRMLPIWAERLDAQGFFDDAEAVGVAHASTPILDRAIPKLEEALADVGVELAVDASITDEASLSTAVLNLKDAEVDRLLLLDGSGFFIIPAFEAQDFRPRYAVTTLSAPHLMESNVPTEALTGAAGIGWVPSHDVDAAHDPGPVSESAERCLQLMSDAGQDLNSREAVDVQLGICETLWSYAAAAEAGGGLTQEAVASGVAALADTFEPLRTFALTFSEGRADTVSAVRDLAFEQGCACFVYSSEAHAIP